MRKTKKKPLLGIALLLAVTILSCKKEKSAFFVEHLLDNKEKQSIELDVTQQSSDKNQFIKEIDDKTSVDNFVKTKSFFKEEDNYIIDYRYPFLDENHQESYKVFNDYIQSHYLDKSRSVKNTLENENLFCDTDHTNPKRYKRNIDYKIYKNKNNVLSVLLYKANYYTDENHYSYMFKALNFNLEKGEFVLFDSIFKPETQHLVVDRLNQELAQKISNQSYYKECWQLTEDTFDAYKDNFVINDRKIKFYFDDCVICPTFAGRYSIEIELPAISNLLRKGIVGSEL